MDSILLDFFSDFEKSFSPPPPSRGKSGKDWWVSRVWSDYVRDWLPHRYNVHFEYPIDVRRLDAALWSKLRQHNLAPAVMDIALEWEWNNNTLAKNFPAGDFRKILEVDARSGLAIIQTRADGNRGSRQADGTVSALQRSWREHRRDQRSVAVIEIRRVLHRVDRVEFVCYFHDMELATQRRFAGWSFSIQSGLSE